MAYSDAQKEATARYNKKAYDRIAVMVKKGRKAEIAAFAQRQNKSMEPTDRRLDRTSHGKRRRCLTASPFCVLGFSGST